MQGFYCYSGWQKLEIFSVLCCFDILQASVLPKWNAFKIVANSVNPCILNMSYSSTLNNWVNVL